MLEYVLNTSPDAKQPPNDVEQSWGASAKLLGCRPPRHWTGRGQQKESGMCGELRVLLFCFSSVHGRMGMGCVSECLYDALLVRRLWTVEKDVRRLISNVRDNDIIRHQLSESPGVIGLLATEVRKLRKKNWKKNETALKEKQPPNAQFL